MGSGGVGDQGGVHVDWIFVDDGVGAGRPIERGAGVGGFSDCRIGQAAADAAVSPLRYGQWLATLSVRTHQETPPC